MNYVAKTVLGLILVGFAFFAVFIVPDMLSATMSKVSIWTGILSFLGGATLVVKGFLESRKTDRLK